LKLDGVKQKKDASTTRKKSASRGKGRGQKLSQNTSGDVLCTTDRKGEGEPGGRARRKPGKGS